MIFALIGSLLVTLALLPVLCAWLMRGGVRERRNAIYERIRAAYARGLGHSLARPRATIAVSALLLLLSLLVFADVGAEFMPHLDEGALWVRATMPYTISFDESAKIVPQVRAIIQSFPEVTVVGSEHGRPDDGTDATGFFNAEFYTPLKPFDEWPRGMNKEKLTAEIQQRLQARYPGVDFEFSQYIEDNVDEAASGVKGANSIKIFGPDLATLDRLAGQIMGEMGKVRGIADLGASNSLGQPTVRIDINRQAAARYGLTPDDINTTIAAAIGGQSPGDLYEPGTDRHFPIVVRLAGAERDSLEAIRHITVAAPSADGQGQIQVPLSELADVRLTSGASFIYREHQERYVPIKFSVRGRDLGSAVLEAQRKVEQLVRLPGGYRTEWVGEFGNLQEALHRLAIVVPLSIALICILLFINFGSIVDVLLAASVIPMALVGGIFALALTGTPFSVSAAIGFVALFGIATMDGIIMLSYYNLHIEQGLDRVAALLHTCHVQMRPVLMTCVVACVGLVPAALSTGIGSQVQRPLALVVVGGMLLTPVLVLLVLPVLIMMFSQRKPLPENAPAQEAAV